MNKLEKILSAVVLAGSVVGCLNTRNYNPMKKKNVADVKTATVVDLQQLTYELASVQSAIASLLSASTAHNSSCSVGYNDCNYNK